MQLFFLFLITISTQCFAANSGPQKSKPKDQVSTHQDYDLEVCKSFNKGTQVAVPFDDKSSDQCETCLSAQAKAIVLVTKPIFSSVKNQLMEDFRKHLLKKISENLNQNTALANCFKGQKPADGIIAKNDCQAAILRSKEVTSKWLTQMRVEMSMMTPDRVPENGDPETVSKGSKFAIQPKPSYFGITPPQLTASEIKIAESQFSQETIRLSKEFVKNNSQSLACVTSDEFQKLDSKCQNMLGGKIALSRYINSRRWGVRKEHEEKYEKILQVAPHLAFVNATSIDDSKINDHLASAYSTLQNRMSDEVKKISSLKTAELGSLIAYKAELNNYLKTLSQVPRPYCDVAQSLINDDSLKETLIGLGIGASAMAGVGVCFVTMGAACAGSAMVVANVAGAAVSEALLISRAQGKLQEAMNKYVAGAISFEEMREAQNNLISEVAFAPAALAGTGLLGNAAKQATLFNRAKLANADELASLWTRGLSTTQADQLALKLSNSADAGMKKGYDKITKQLTELAKSKNENIPVGLQDKFMTNLNKAIANLKDKESLNTEFYGDLLDKAVKANPGSAAFENAQKELATQTDILRYVNAQAGQSFTDKLDKFLVSVSLKLKRISSKDAQIFKSCIVQNQGGTASLFKSKDILACWVPERSSLEQTNKTN